MELLSEQECGRWKLPPYSPDLNPIENFWPVLKNAIRKRGPAATLAESEEKSNEAVAECQTAAGIALVRKFIDSMPNRMQAVIRKQGKPTKYVLGDSVHCHARRVHIRRKVFLCFFAEK